MTANKPSLDQVREFHVAAGLSHDRSPNLDCDWMGRYHLMKEELDEFKSACQAGDLIAAFDALLDLQYVLDGSFLELGLDHVKPDGMAEIHRSNMSKLKTGSDKGQHQKIRKGPDYTPPQLTPIIKRCRE